MIVQCSQCRRIRIDGVFRLPWPGELDGEIAKVFCSRCAKERLAMIQTGAFARLDAAARRKASGS